VSEHVDRDPSAAAQALTAINGDKTGGAIVEFNPLHTRTRIGAIQGAIVHARNIKEWGPLNKAIDDLITEQRAYVGWYVSVVANAGGDRQTANGKALLSQSNNGRLSVEDIERQTGVKKHQVSKWRGQLRDENAYRETLRNAALAPVWGTGRFGDGGRPGSADEWYSPPELIARVRRVAPNGAISLDPASCAKAQETVQAERYFDIDIDGLTIDWFGFVWANFPFSQITPWIEKLIREYKSGRVLGAITITNNSTETRWYQQAKLVADAVCLLRERIKFVDRNGKDTNPHGGQVLFYFGADVAAFEREFGEIGSIERRKPQSLLDHYEQAPEADQKELLTKAVPSLPVSELLRLLSTAQRDDLISRKFGVGNASIARKVEKIARTDAAVKTLLADAGIKLSALKVVFPEIG
jgi:hypothetical protein